MSCPAGSCTYECGITVNSDGISETECDIPVICTAKPVIDCSAVCPKNETLESTCTNRAVDLCLKQITVSDTPDCSDSEIFNTCPPVSLSTSGCFGSGKSLPTGGGVALSSLAGCEECVFECTDEQPESVWDCLKPSPAACFGKDDREMAFAYQRACQVECKETYGSCVEEENVSCTPWTYEDICDGVHGAVIDNCDNVVTCEPASYDQNSTIGLSVYGVIAGSAADLVVGVMVVLSMALYLVWCGHTQVYIDEFAQEEEREKSYRNA